jgi:hypothetical protein
MYVPNTISIPTHEVDFSHQALGFREITRNRQWSRRKVRRGEGRKKERKRGRKKRGGVALFYAKVTPGWLARLLHKSCQLTWCDFIDVAQHPPA